MMLLVLLILWLAPGALVLTLTGQSRKCRGAQALVWVLLEDLLVFLAVWTLLFLRYGWVRLGFTPEPRQEVWHTIYELGFMAKYVTLTLGAAGMLGLLQRGMIWLWKRRRSHGN